MIKFTIPNGYSGNIGLADKGWYASALLMDDADRVFTCDYKNAYKKLILKDGCDFNDWVSGAVSPKRRLIYIEEDNGAVKQHDLTAADRVYGPALPKSKSPVPVVAWSERKDDGNWCLVIKKGDEIFVPAMSEKIIRTPSVDIYNDVCYVATCMDTGKGTKTRVYAEDGSLYFETDGNRPVICSTGSSLYLICEQPETEESGISLKLMDITDANAVKQWRISADDINIQADMISAPGGDVLYIAFESTRGWGVDHCTGRHKDINVWQCMKGEAPRPLCGKTGSVELPREAFMEVVDGIKSNITYAYPKPAYVGGRLAVFMRRFRFYKMKTNGWYVCMTLYDGEEWSELKKVSENSGTPDTEYGVAELDGSLLGFFPCCEYLEWNRSDNHRIEIQSFEADDAKPLSPVPASVRDLYEYPYSIKGVGKEPPEIKDKPGNMKLIWGDMHVHSSYSKCMSNVDGSVDDNLRYCRDILGCRLLTVTDHTRHLSLPEYLWIMDKLEEYIDDSHFILYSGEPGCSPDHHTNVYSLDRGVFDLARLIVNIREYRSEIYEAIKEMLPKKSYIALRHFHGLGGPQGIASEDTLKTWDPELEVAMESMQCRGNFMVDKDTYPNLPLFPTNFLNVGAKIGLVGGTDHTTDSVINHVCLTGFWVEEESAAGIWDAIINRRTIAAANGKAAVWTELNGMPMGSEVTIEGAVKINVSINSAFKIKRVCLIKDGTPMDWLEIGRESFKGVLVDKKPEPGYHWYCVTAICDSAFSEPAPYQTWYYGKKRNNDIIVHASPYFVTVKP